jgi:hypothetical protein
MGIRALDVGTSRTPLVGQPSTADFDIGAGARVSHPGPIHFYLLAGFVRLLGGWLGMLVVSVLIVEACLLVAAWVMFRALGPAACVFAAVLLGAVAFTTGASSLVDPVSSNIAGYPLLCSAVLCWCLLCGDLRLLPLSTAVVSFTAQQHLSVAPATVVLSGGAFVGLWVSLARSGRLRRRGGRRDVLRWTGWSVVVAVVLWSPVVAEQLFTNDGNLSRLLRYTGGDRMTVGTASAFRQIAHTLGLPPLLGRRELTGWNLLTTPSLLTWVTAGLVAVVVALLGLRWFRASDRRASLSLIVVIAAVAGFANGSSVPVNMSEQGRLSFYHWSFVLAFFAYLVVGLGVLDVFRGRRAVGSRVGTGLVSVALLAIIVPAAVNPGLDRTTNSLVSAHGYLERRYVRSLADTVLAHREELGNEVVLLARGGNPYAGFGEALAYELTERGLDIRHPYTRRRFVADQRLVDREVDSALVVQSVEPGRASIPGRMIGEVQPEPNLDRMAYRALIVQAESADEVRLGPDATAALAALRDEGERVVLSYAFRFLTDAPVWPLQQKTLRFLLEHPIEEPRLDPRLMRRVLRSAPDGWSTDNAFGLRVYLLTRDELRAVASPGELPPPDRTRPG